MHPFTILIPSDYGFHYKIVVDDQNCGIRWKGGACHIDLDSTDNITLLASTRADSQSITTNMGREAGKIGLRLNSEKIKVIIIGETGTFPQIIIGHQTTEEVKHFICLSSIVEKYGKVEAVVNSRIGKLSVMFPRLHSIWPMLTISLRSKIHLYNTLITPIATYARKPRNDIKNLEKAHCISAELFT